MGFAHTRLAAIAASAVLLAGTSAWAGSATGRIAAGTTFGSNDAFQFTNTSAPGVTITSLLWDLTPINAFFDTTSADPGSSFSELEASGTSDAVGHTFPSNASVDGDSTLLISFTGFDAGETFKFGVDTDLFTAIDSAGVNGEQFVGATVQVTFSDGTERFGAYVPEAGAGTQVFIDQPVPPPPPPTAIPLPPAALAGLIGLAGVPAAMRRMARRHMA